VGPIGTLVWDYEYKKGARASSNAAVALPRAPWAVIPATDPVIISATDPVGTGRDLSLPQPGRCGDIIPPRGVQARWPV